MGQAYAEIYITSGSTAQTLNSSAGTYDLLNPTSEWTANGTAILTTTAASGQINLDVAGTYFITSWVEFTAPSGSAGDTYTFKYALGGTTAPRSIRVAKTQTGTEPLAFSASGIVTATAGQALALYAASSVSSPSITVTEAGFSAILMAET